MSFNTNDQIIDERSVVLQQLGTFASEGDALAEEEVTPEECIPDLPENQKAREFLKNAPSKGLFMPLGTQVKVMQCWRCKAYGHRTGDAECPLKDTGNIISDAKRQAREDPMSKFVAEKYIQKQEKYERVEQLKLLLEEIREEEREREALKRENKSMKKDKSNKRKKQRKS